MKDKPTIAEVLKKAARREIERVCDEKKKRENNADDQIGKSFSLTVIERLRQQPAFRIEVLRQIEESIHKVINEVGYGVEDLKVAKKMLDQVIEADEGVDK